MKVGDRVLVEVPDLMGSVRERPSLALGLLTVLLGAIVATRLANLFPRRQTMRHRLRRGRKRIEAAHALFSLVLRLLSNPIVQGYVRGTVTRQLSRKR